jgi:hypothetical protein
LSEDGEVFHHELGGRFHRVQLQEVNLRLLAQLADRVLGNQLVRRHHVFDVIPGLEKFKSFINKTLIIENKYIHRNN